MKVGPAFALLAIAIPLSAAAQPAKSLRDQLVGTWSFVIAEIGSSCRSAISRKVC